MPASNDTIMLPARPEPTLVEASRTTVVVIDLQYACASAGGSGGRGPTPGQ
jgi:ureidoacrylate peracid hydrolase